MKIIFFGIGSIGIRHARILKDTFDFDLFAYRTKKGQEENNLNIEEIYSLKEAFEKNPDIALITNPTYLHIKTALECAKRNIHLFIEKPLSHNLEFVDKLEKEIIKRKLVSYVAYNLRFHPLIEKIKEINEQEKPITFNVICSSYLPDWRPNQDYSKSYSAKKEMGGGVALDLSHEFDYISWLFGEIKEMKGYCDKVSNMDINCEDLLEAEITCKTGIKGKVHLDCFTKDTERKICIEYPDKQIEADLINNMIEITDNGYKKTIMFKCKKDETYIKQFKYFFIQYRNKNTNMMNNYSDALKTFKKIMDFKDKYCKI